MYTYYIKYLGTIFVPKRLPLGPVREPWEIMLAKETPLDNRAPRDVPRRTSSWQFFKTPKKGVCLAAKGTLPGTNRKSSKTIRWRHTYFRRLFSKVCSTLRYLARFLLFFHVESKRDWDPILISVEWSHHCVPQSVLPRVWPHPQRPTLAPGQSGKGRRRSIWLGLSRPDQSFQIAGKWCHQCKVFTTPAASLPIK